MATLELDIRLWSPIPIGRTNHLAAYTLKSMPSVAVACVCKYKLTLLQNVTKAKATRLSGENGGKSAAVGSGVVLFNKKIKREIIRQCTYVDRKLARSYTIRRAITT